MVTAVVPGYTGQGGGGAARDEVEWGELDAGAKRAHKYTRVWGEIKVH